MSDLQDLLKDIPFEYIEEFSRQYSLNEKLKTIEGRLQIAISYYSSFKDKKGGTMSHRKVYSLLEDILYGHMNVIPFHRMSKRTDLLDGVQ